MTEEDKANRDMLQGMLLRCLESTGNPEFAEIILPELRNMLEENNANFKSMCELQAKIIAASKGAAKENAKRWIEGVEQPYRTLRQRLTSRIFQLERSDNTPRRSESQQTHQAVLPTISVEGLGEFNGTHADWPQFRDLFVALVGSRNLPNLTKLLHLKKACVGPAALAIRGYEPLAECYEAAWNTLRGIYEDDYAVVQALIDKLIDMPPSRHVEVGELRRVIDTTVSTIRQLKNLGEEVDKWDSIIINLMTRKLPPGINEAWEQLRKRDVRPTLKEFSEFLDARARARAFNSTTTPVPGRVRVTNCDTRQDARRPTHIPRYKDNHRISGGPPIRKIEYNLCCKLCSGNHRLANCPVFLNKSQQDKKATVIRLGACLNCLNSGHQASQCRSVGCYKKGCNNDKHHWTLCSSALRRNGTSPQQPSTRAEGILHNIPNKQQDGVGSMKIAAVLGTAEIRILSTSKMSRRIRCLVDSGAQTNLMTLACARDLDLIIEPGVEIISGIGGPLKSFGTVKINICTRRGANLYMQFEFIVVPKILSHMPSALLENATEGIIAKSALADIRYAYPAPVDIILGVNVCAKIFNERIIKLREGLIAQQTKLGYVVFGECAEESNLCCHIALNDSTAKDASLDAALERLWRIDQAEIPECELTPDEVWCEEYFAKTCYRAQDGRYVTSISIKPENLNLGQSYERALERFKSLERRLQRDPQLAERYVGFMREYEELGHMQVATTPIDRTRPHYYIPHHPVLKKFRVVFDASAKTTNGKSLNDIQIAGPKVQPELYDTILRFRLGKIALTADVAKMYRQVRVEKDQWDLQRIFWREHPDGELKEYWLTVITYGLTSASYNAVKAMLRCASDNEVRYPIAAKVISENFYMDDLLASVNTPEEAKEVYTQLNESLTTGGFELTKWCSNEAGIITRKGAITPIAIDKGSENISVLGLIWDPETDNLKFKVDLRQNDSQILTKRMVASQGARIFDPNGYLSPVTIRAKMFLQNLWRTGCNWDEPLPQELSSEWRSYYNSLESISGITLPRWLGKTATSKVQIHAFCDASIKAYGAVLYMRSENSMGDVSVRLLTSKSKVADLQTVSMPRMELCAAKLAAETVQRILKTLKVKPSNAYYWTDSQIVLYWLRKFPSELKVFVGNRVSAIQACSNIANWGHIDSKKNPADIITKGLTPQDLSNSSMWWNGPEFLSANETTWPKWAKGDPTAAEAEALNSEQRIQPKGLVYLVTKISDSKEICLLERYEKIQKIVRITAYVKRFITVCKSRASRTSVSKSSVKRKSQRKRASSSRRNNVLEATSPQSAHMSIPSNVLSISVAEYQAALTYWIKYTQLLHFPDEVQRICKGQPVSRTSRISKFVPFMDNAGVMRMRGRIERASLTYEQRHPIILPGDSMLAIKFMAEAHQRTMHGGSQLCIQYLRDKFWIIGLRSAMRKYIRGCVKCVIHRKKMAQQLMADLPATRVQISRPFANCGVDYAGPFSLKPYKNSRGSKIQLEAYVAVFVCFVTKAVHLELVGDLTTQSFLAALDRMILRRNHVVRLYSDQGRNFIGAANELERVYQTWQSSEIIDELTLKGITWQFNTPLAPHQGGLWEAAVKSFKFHLYRVVGNSRLTFEELNTLLVRIEGCLNSRPLIAPTDDPQDLTVLTPGHLISGDQVVKPLGPIPAEVHQSKSISWNEIRTMEEDFWKRWSSDYLTELQKRTKWFRDSPNVEVGDLVVLRAVNIPPGQWKRGRIVRVLPGNDGAVRSVVVKTATGEYERPITRLCVLPVDKHVIENI